LCPRPIYPRTTISEPLSTLIRVGLSKENVRIKDVKPIIGELDIFVPHGKENVLVSEANGLEEFKEFFNVLGYLDFGEILRKYTELTGRDMRKLRGFLMI